MNRRGRTLLLMIPLIVLMVPVVHGQQGAPSTTTRAFSSGWEVRAGPGNSSLFTAPGVAHCGGGAGPAPSRPPDALLAWVEGGF